jgi:predicted dehydrogenase
VQKQINWGILGAGRIANDFCTAVNFTEGSQVYAVASRNEETGKAFANKFNATVYYNNYLSLVNDPNVDVIYIATPHPFHYEQAKLCLQHNKPVLCEKPMCMNYQQTSELIELANSKNLFLMEAMWTACMPFMNMIIDIINAGLIGDIQYLHSSLCFTAPPNFDDRLYNNALGGGSILDVGVYVLSFATKLLGTPTSLKSIVTHTSTGVDATANMILEYTNGATAHLLSSIAITTPQECSIVGTKGRIYVKEPMYKATEFILTTDDGATKTYLMPHLCNGFEYEVKEVMNCLNNNLLQSTKVPHSQTLTVSRLMDEVLQQAGIKYTD